MKQQDTVCGPGIRWAAALAAVLFLGMPPAAAQEPDPYAEEPDGIPGDDLTGPLPGDDVPGEPDGRSGGRTLLEEEERPRLDGAAARRRLLFQDGLDERELRYPDGLEPAPPVARSDPEVYDARVRGRNANVLADLPAGWSVDSSVSAGLFADDNPRLLRDDQASDIDRGAWGFFVEPRLAVARRTQRSLFQGVVRTPYDQFYSFEGDLNDDLGAFDQFAGLQYDVFGRESAFNLFTNIANSTTRTAIVEDTGEDLSGNRALTYGGGGSFKYSLTPDSVIQLSGSARRQDIEDDTEAEFLEDPFLEDVLQDSTFYQAALDYRTQVTGTDVVGGGAIYEVFLPDGFFSPDVRIVTALLSWSRIINPSLNFTLDGGAQIVTSEPQLASADSETTVQPFVEATVFWTPTGEDFFVFTYRRSVDPTAAGEVRNTDQIEAEYRRALTRTISVGAPLLVVFQRDTFIGAVDRTFVEFAPNIVWTFRENWALGGEYRLQVNDFNDSTATSNAAFLSLTYFGRLLP